LPTDEAPRVRHFHRNLECRRFSRCLRSLRLFHPAGCRAAGSNNRAGILRWAERATVAFKYSSGGGRTFDVSGKNPVAIEHEPDFTFSAVVLTGLKFPTGDTSRLE